MWFKHLHYNSILTTYLSTVPKRHSHCTISKQEIMPSAANVYSCTHKAHVGARIMPTNDSKPMQIHIGRKRWLQRM